MVLRIATTSMVTTPKHPPRTWKTSYMEHTHPGARRSLWSCTTRTMTTTISLNCVCGVYVLSLVTVHHHHVVSQGRSPACNHHGVQFFCAGCPIGTSVCHAFCLIWRRGDPAVVCQPV